MNNEEIIDLRDNLNLNWLSVHRQLRGVKDAARRRKILRRAEAVPLVDISSEEIEKILFGGENGEKSRK